MVTTEGTTDLAIAWWSPPPPPPALNNNISRVQQQIHHVKYHQQHHLPRGCCCRLLAVCVCVCVCFGWMLQTFDATLWWFYVEYFPDRRCIKWIWLGMNAFNFEPHKMKRRHHFLKGGGGGWASMLYLTLSFSSSHLPMLEYYDEWMVDDGCTIFVHLNDARLWPM